VTGRNKKGGSVRKEEERSKWQEGIKKEEDENESWTDTEEKAKRIYKKSERL
jgi:hypothetical protein